MMTFESRKSRRMIVRLDRGEELCASLEALAKREGISAAWVRGIGSLAWVELDRHDQARRKAEPPQRFETPSEVLSLEGNLAMQDGAPRALLHATLARRTDNGVDVIGGRVREAGVFSCELVIEHFADLVLARARDAATGLDLFEGGEARPAEPRPALEARPTEPRPAEARPRESRPPQPRPAQAPPAQAASSAWTRELEPEEPEPAPPEPARSTGGVSWADVAAVSAAPPVIEEPVRRGRHEVSRAPALRDTRDEPPDELQPQRGDFLEHRQFGLCKIDREDEEGGLVIRLPSGVRKTIKLDFMEVGQPRMEGTRRIFPIRPRKR